MITLITGAPGTGKSNALVSLLAELGKERALYVNGIPEFQVPHIVLEDLATWHELVPDGSIIAGDEAQGTFRPRGPGQKVPEHVSKLETHRHRGLDIYLVTQGPNLLDANVRALVGRHVHLRDLGILGRWWYEWPECADNCRTGWKNAPIKKRYRLDKAAQSKYKSASIHIKPIRSVPWMLAVMAGALVTVGVTTWSAYGTISAKLNPGKQAASLSPDLQAAGLPGTAGSPAQGQSQEPKFIDDRIAWIPRISGKPETAPAFDELRKVVAMPRIAAGYIKGREVRCYTQQGNRLDISEAECRAWLANPPFDPYRAPDAPQQAAQPQSQPATSSGDVRSTLIVIDGPGARDPLGAKVVTASSR